MKKKFLLVSVLFLALILVACGGQSAKDVKAEPEKNNVSAEEEKVLKAELQTGEIKASTIDELNELVPQEIDSRVVVKRDNISYNISLPVRRAIFLQVLKKPYFLGLSAHFPFLGFGNKARIFAGTFQS